MKRVFVPSMILSALLLPGLFAQTAAPVHEKEPKLQRRRERQQQRIAQGVENGSLSAKETANLENKEYKLNREIHHDRVANGGNLTNKEKAQINRQQNRLSKQIYKDKHNEQTQPGK